MGWLDEALRKSQELEKKQSTTINENELLKLKTEEDRKNLTKELKKLYENATDREIDRAIDYAFDKIDEPKKKSDFMKQVRIKLED